MRWIALTLLLLLGLALLGREILVVGQGRRSGEDPGRLYRRFRNRTKAYGLLMVIFLMAAFYEDLARAGHFRATEAIAYFGVAVILLFWFLIVLARDFRETAMAAMRQSEQLTVQSLKELEEEIRRKRGKRDEGRGMREEG